MYIELQPANPDDRKIAQIADILRKGGVIIYPTDTVYGLGCDMMNKAAVEKLCRIKGLDPGKALLTFICRDIAQVSQYTRPLDNAVFRMMKRNSPGPFTFILEANNEVPKLVQDRKRTIGVRIPDHDIPQRILEAMGRPMLSISVRSEDEILEYYTDPSEIFEEFNSRVDAVVDGGPGNIVGSTIVDCTGVEPVVIRQGAEMLK